MMLLVIMALEFRSEFWSLVWRCGFLVHYGTLKSWSSYGLPGGRLVGLLLTSRPDALWVLSPEIVVRISSSQEKQNYGTICGMCVMCMCNLEVHKTFIDVVVH